MHKISIVIADSDSMYLRQISNYLLNNAPEFAVESFSKAEKLEHFLNSGEASIDILLLGEEMRCRETDQCRATAKILLCANGGGTEYEGYDTIKKYQKTADILNEILLLYGERSGNIALLSENGKGAKLIASYSPVGGSGKTTLSLLVANALGQMGKTLYLNYERVNSIRTLLPEKATVNLSDLLVMIRTGEKNVGLTLHNKMYSDPVMGFSYVNPADSALELNEITVDEQILLLKEAVSQRDISFVVLDLDSELDSDKLRILQLCDSIIMPFLPETIGTNKVKQFYREMALHLEYQNIMTRIIPVGNKIGDGAESYLRQCGIFECVSPAAMLPWSDALANLPTSIQRGLLNVSMVSEIINRIAQ